MYCTLTCQIPVPIVKQLQAFDIKESKQLTSIHELHWKEGRKLPKKTTKQTLNDIKKLHEAGRLPATTEELAIFIGVHVEQYGYAVSYLIKKGYCKQVDEVPSIKRPRRKVLRFNITDKGLAT